MITETSIIGSNSTVPTKSYCFSQCFDIGYYYRLTSYEINNVASEVSNNVALMSIIGIVKVTSNGFLSRLNLNWL
nr:hypothetical protein [Mycoplasmopsis bovis]QQH18993.1 hypothetical protein HYE48_00945 [Mycoplasmopsis bovis]